MKSDKPSVTDEICSMCKRLKSMHTSEELLACLSKMAEFKETDTGGAGIS